MPQDNPFSLSFGKKPSNIIERTLIENEIIDTFNSKDPSYYATVITGIRGSGKTVLLSSISNRLKKEKDWVVVDLSADSDLLTSLAASLSERNDLLKTFKDAKINISIFGIGIEIDKSPANEATVAALDKMLYKLTQKKKKVLVTIDEVVSNTYMRKFVSQFQIFLRNEYNVFLLMTGLYENVDAIQNEKTLTFFYRAPKITLEPLNIGSIASKYAQTFDLDEVESIRMAKETRGYPYAYQVLGYLCFQQGKKWEEVIDDYEKYLFEYSYEKIWSELSPKDRDVIFAIADTTTSDVESIRTTGSFSSNYFTVYRNRLIKRGVIYSPDFGKLEFTLPRWQNFVRKKRIEMEV